MLSLSKASQSQMDARTPPTTTAYRRETILTENENQSSGAIILGRKMETSWDLFSSNGPWWQAGMGLAVREVIHAEDVLRCLMFEVDPGQ
jgi:hypothetical protein